MNYEAKVTLGSHFWVTLGPSAPLQLSFYFSARRSVHRPRPTPPPPLPKLPPIKGACAAGGLPDPRMRTQIACLLQRRMRKLVFNALASPASGSKFFPAWK